MNDLVNICSICSKKDIEKQYILFYVKVVKERYIETDLLYYMTHFSLSKIVQLGSADCVMKVFPFNHINDDYEFTVTLYQFISGTLMPGCKFLHPDSMIFYPFEINEDQYQIIEYHG